MALHKDFPKDPYAILDPNIRWFPDGVSSQFKYYFAQREALETVIWLYEVAKVKDKYDLIRYNSTGVLSPQMFPGEWLRFVIKMATGAGKTKVMSLLIAWAYFHKKYEEDSNLAKNFLLITPNVIVFERIKYDFDGLKIFFSDPVLPENGYQGQNWQDDFQITLHLQDDLHNVSDTGNIFLTNIHRVFEGDVREASALRIEYKNSEGFIATYYLDFFVKKDEKTVYIIETKGREEENDKLKFERLQKWCEDVNNRQSRVVYKALYIKQEEWEKDKLKNFDEIIRIFCSK